MWPDGEDAALLGLGAALAQGASGAQIREGRLALVVLACGVGQRDGVPGGAGDRGRLALRASGLRSRFLPGLQRGQGVEHLAGLAPVFKLSTMVYGATPWRGTATVGAQVGMQAVAARRCPVLRSGSRPAFAGWAGARWAVLGPSVWLSADAQPNHLCLRSYKYTYVVSVSGVEYGSGANLGERACD